MIAELAKALVAEAQENLYKAYRKAQAIEHGTRGIMVGFNGPEDRNKPANQVRWAVWLVKWDKPTLSWRNIRRIDKDLGYVNALRLATSRSQQRDIPVVN